MKDQELAGCLGLRRKPIGLQQWFGAAEAKAEAVRAISKAERCGFLVALCGRYTRRDPHHA